MPPNGTYQGGSTGGSTNPVRLASCVIEDSFAHVGIYLVRLPAGPIVPAIDLYHTSMTPLGVRPLSTYMPKARVLVLFTNDLEFPIIIGGVPKAVGDGRLLIPDSIVMRSRVGQVEDPMHFSAFTDERSVMANHSAGRAIDVLPGDWGYITDFGMSFFLGRFMASMKASDLAKVEAFWGDDLLRLVGYNYELFTAGLEDRRVNDEGEYNEVVKRTPYPWEALGIGARGQSPAENFNGQLAPAEEEASYEPKEVDQLIIPRQLILRGYLGDLSREIISAPPDDLTVETYEKETKHRGLLEILKSSDGTYAVRSAKAIILEKYSSIPVPKELIAPEDPKGNSKADGYVAAGVDVQVPEFKWGDETLPGIRAAQLYDYLAYTYGKYTTTGLVKHDKDWFYPEESALSVPVTGNVYNKGFTQLETKFSLDLPSYGELKIDHRGGRDTVRYYQSRSCISQLDDGSVVIEDGYGSQISMRGGHIYLTCPGDVWAQPGRSFIAWAPYDAILKAGNSAEITASQKDVRIKAERNLHMLGGNSTTDGGVLIESRSENPSTASDFDEPGDGTKSHGIILKAAESSLQAFARDVYVGLNKSNSTGGKLSLDAGDGDVFVQGNDVVTHLKGVFAIMAEDRKKLFAINQFAAIISAPTYIGGTVTIAPSEGETVSDLVVGGTLVVHDNAIVDGIVATNSGYTALLSTQVGKMDKKVDINPNKESLGNIINEQVTSVSTLLDSALAIAEENEDTSLGNASFQDKIKFSFRDSEDDLGLDQADFIIVESRWQQIMAAAGGNGKTWEEPEVQGPNGEATLPFPGKQAWTDWAVFQQVASVNFDLTTGKAKNREDMVNIGNTPVRVALSEYPVVKTS